MPCFLSFRGWILQILRFCIDRIMVVLSFVNSNWDKKKNLRKVESQEARTKIGKHLHFYCTQVKPLKMFSEIFYLS